MRKVFVLKNQQGLFWNRQHAWVNGSEANGLFRADHKDEAINEVFEISARDFDQRIEVLEVDANVKGVPTIPKDWIVELPEPQELSEIDEQTLLDEQSEPDEQTLEAQADNSPAKTMQAENPPEETENCATRVSPNDSDKTENESCAKEQNAQGNHSLDFARVESA